MQHIARFELMASRPQDLGTRHFGFGIEERQHILQLVTEAIGSARLAEGRSSPNATGQILVEQPTVEQQIEGRFRGFDLDGGQEILPEATRTLPGVFNLRRILVALDQVNRLLTVGTLADQKVDLTPFARRQTCSSISALLPPTLTGWTW